MNFMTATVLLLYEGLTKLGFTCIKPQGAFYLWLKSPVAKEEEFVEAAKKYHLILVKEVPSAMAVMYALHTALLMRQ